MKSKSSVIAVFGLTLVLLLPASLGAQWSTMSIESNPTGSPYRCWHKLNVTQVDDVIFEGGQPDGFCNQVFSRPHVEYNANGDALITGAGSSTGGFGDSILLMLRRSSDGYFDTNPSPDTVSHVSEVLHWPTVTCAACPPEAQAPPMCSVPGTHVCDWSWVGGLGGGGGFTHTPIKTIGGYDYFAVVEVSDYHKVRNGAPFDFDNGDVWDHCPDNVECGCSKNTSNNPGRAWFTWAVSKDETGQGGPPAGVKWSFVTAAGGTTTNPFQSVKLLSRPDGMNVRYITSQPNEVCGINDPEPARRTGGGWSSRFGHPAVFFNKYDNYFYIAFQWGWGNTLPAKLTSAVWFRMQFNPYQTYGFGPIQRLVDAPSANFASAACSPPAVGCGLIPSDDSWIPGATYPTGGATPDDFSMLYNDVSAGFTPVYGPRNFDSILMTYSGDKNHAGRFYRKGTERTFPFFGSTQSLTTNYSVLDNGLTSSSCTVPTLPPKAIAFSPGTWGGYITAVQQVFPPLPSDTNGAPSLLGYVGGKRTDLGNPCDRAGLIAVHLPLTGSATFPVVKGVNLVSGPASGNTTVTLTGVGFVPGTTPSIKFGSAAASMVSVVNSTTITAKTPALSPGAISDILVTNTNNQTGKLWDVFLADFTDVPSNNAYHTNVVKIARDHITVGCTGGNFCVTNNISRGEMAAFLLKSKYVQLAYSPIPATGTVFGDVGTGTQFAAFIEELSREGITSGCGSGNYCPTNPVLRQEMAVFLLKTKFGSTYTPPNCHGQFLDVACPSLYANWIEDAANKGIMPGGTGDVCQANKFCPTDSVIRGPMANYLVAAFGL